MIGFDSGLLFSEGFFNPKKENLKSCIFPGRGCHIPLSALLQMKLNCFSLVNLSSLPNHLSLFFKAWVITPAALSCEDGAGLREAPSAVLVPFVEFWSSSARERRVSVTRQVLGQERVFSRSMCYQLVESLGSGRWSCRSITAIGPNLVTWPQLAAREAEKYSLAGKLSAQEGRTHLQNSLPHR